MSSNKSLPVADIITNSSIETRGPEEEKTFSSTIFTPRQILLTILGFVYIISFLVNLKVIQVVYTRQSKRITTRLPLSSLVAHLSLICILFSIFSVFDTCSSGTLYCQVVDFCKDSLVCAFALNTLLILNEQVRTMSDFNEDVNVYYLPGRLWLTAFTTATVSKALMYFKSLQLANLNLIAAIFGVTFEILRFLFNHLALGIAMSYDLAIVHFKLAQLQMPYQRLKSKIENILGFYIHFGIFIFTWICYGLCCAAVRFALFVEFNLQPYTILVYYIQLGFHAYLSLHPLLHILLMDGKLNYLCLTGYFTRDENLEEEAGRGIVDEEENYLAVEPTNPGLIEESNREKLKRPTTLFRELSSSPRKFGLYKIDSTPQQMKVQDGEVDKYWDIPYIDEGSDVESICDDQEYSAAGQPKKVSFSGTDEITYYETDSEEKKSTTSVEEDVTNFGKLETDI